MTYREIEFRDEHNRPVWSLQRSYFGVHWKTVSIYYYRDSNIYFSSAEQFSNKKAFKDSVHHYFKILGEEKEAKQVEKLAKKFKPIVLAQYEVV